MQHRQTIGIGLCVLLSGFGISSIQYLSPTQQLRSLSTNSSDIQPDPKARQKCQIIYVLGVEGSMHHGFTPILGSLAQQQVDPETNEPFEVLLRPLDLRKALVGRREDRVVDDESLVKEVISKICPRDGKNHVTIEDLSFPTGFPGRYDQYRYPRLKSWSKMNVYEIADNDHALRHPLDLTKFLEAYSPYADIKFVAIHRPFMEAMASHTNWDADLKAHSNIVRGYMLLLCRFLDSLGVDAVTGKSMWTLVCTKSIATKTYKDEKHRNKSRRNIIANVAEFMGWSEGVCSICWDTWHDSKKNHKDVLGKKQLEFLNEHMTELHGVWPPVVLENEIPEQQCEI